MQTHHSSSKKIHTVFFYRTMLLILLSGILLGTYTGARAETTVSRLDIVFVSPFGGGFSSFFGPRYTYDNNGFLIENTDYGIKNLDLGSRTTCFGQAFNQLWHAGEDLYWYDRSVGTDGFPVYSAAVGVVMYAPTTINYPGSVIIIRHSTATGYIYTVYSHINQSSVNVVPGQNVAQGTLLGSVLYQGYTGDYPTYHPGLNDSHLHFEIRNFYDASNIYAGYPSCNISGNIAGKGYTYPQLPDQFPNSSNHYIHPSIYIYKHQYHSSLPLIISGNSGVQTP